MDIFTIPRCYSCLKVATKPREYSNCCVWLCDDHWQQKENEESETRKYFSLDAMVDIPFDMSLAAAIRKFFDVMTGQQRLEFISQKFPCCRHCGSLNVNCRCWNDE